MKIYVIGGYVRDTLMKRQPHDKDYVVVGATVEEMLRLGFKQVGKDFPVFLHKNTKEEYALARKEIKTGDKHTDFAFEFSPDITLKEDCLRRDFTINALALDEQTGEIIDYFGGREDIINRQIRIIDEKGFKQDPLRILRACRFAATLDFDITPDSKRILIQMVKSGMLQHLTVERVWIEMQKSLQKNTNSAKFFTVLSEIGGLTEIFPEFTSSTSEKSLENTKYCLSNIKEQDEICKWAVFCVNQLCFDKGKNDNGADIIKLINKRLKTPKEYLNFSLMFYNTYPQLAKFSAMNVSEKYDLVKTISNNFKDETRLHKILCCFKACYFEIVDDIESIKNYKNICDNIIAIYRKLHNFTPKKFSLSQQQELKQKQGKEKGEYCKTVMMALLIEEKLA